MRVSVVESPDVRSAGETPARPYVELGFDLTSADGGELQRAAGEIYRRVRTGERVRAGVVGGPRAVADLVEACDATGLDVAPSDRIGELAVRDAIIAANEQAAESPREARHKTVRVAVAGLGVVGGGAALRILREPEQYDLVGAMVRSPSKTRDAGLEAVKIVTDLDAMFALAPDVIIDALSSGEAGRALTKAALSRGVSVVSANKQALAGVLGELHALARESGGALAYSASVGGGAPLIETVQRAGPAPERIEAILNGTVNFILSGLQTGADFDQAVRAAQAAGFAEEDPSADLSGLDAAAKAAILIREAHGVDFDPAAIPTRALTAELYQQCAANGGVFRQVTRIERSSGGEISASVDIIGVDPDGPLGRTIGEGNAVNVTTRGGELAARGRGAGRIPTVESVLADLAELVRP